MRPPNQNVGGTCPTRLPLLSPPLYVFARAKFFSLTKEACSESFKVNIDKALSHVAGGGGKVDEESVRNLLFGDYMDADRLYDEITDIPALIRTMEQ